MKKTMRKRLHILAVALLVATMLGASYSIALAENDYLKIQDFAEILDQTEKEELENYLETTCQEKQFDIVIVTTRDTDIDLMSTADDLYDENDFGYGANKDGCLLLLTVDDEGPLDYYISTTGFGITALTDYGIDYLGSTLVDDFKANGLESALDSYARNVFGLYDQAIAGEPYDEPPAQFNWTSSIGMALILGLIIALVLAGGHKKQLKSVRLKRAASNYLRPGSMKVSRSSDVYMYSTVTSTMRAESESSGGGSSTHVGSSGTTHGGGGGSFR